MLKNLKKKYNCLLLILMLVMSSSIVSNASTTVTLVNDHQKIITRSTPYISPTFTPQTDSIYIIYSMVGSTQSYSSTYYVERYSNGTWIVEDSYTLKGGGTISTGYWVTPNAAYRIRAVSNDPYTRHIMCNIVEYRD